MIYNIPSKNAFWSPSLLCEMLPLPWDEFNKCAQAYGRWKRSETERGKREMERNANNFLKLCAK